MMYLRVLASVSLTALLALQGHASFDSNLNYNSPSGHHPNLGIDIPLVSHRSFKRDATAFQPSELNFTHGVASGDPYADSVILWTRVAPSLVSSDSDVTVTGTVPLYNHDTDSYIKADANPICVDWAISQVTSSKAKRAVSSGRAYTTGDIDYTVKVKIHFSFCSHSAQQGMPVGHGAKKMKNFGHLYFYAFPSIKA